MAAKKGARNADPEIMNSARTSISRSFIKRDIAKIAREEWTQYWKTTNQGQQYSKFQTNLELKMKLKELKQADRLTFTTFTQIKLGHGYFKSYLGNNEDKDADKEGKVEDGSPTVANKTKGSKEDKHEEVDENGKEKNTNATVENTSKKAETNKHKDANEDVKEKDSNKVPVDAEKEHDPSAAAREENNHNNDPPIAPLSKQPLDDEPSSTTKEEKKNCITLVPQPLLCPRNPYPLS
ncbi:hypothetical protein LPUS_05538 [Lasallia pustulata]|uniref:Uncharacterized protein n=1 Tax=Lasallia pustulata TaxID=136370 RepID=A0A1W5CYZ4_9LECA|nr:hypothetical protein LPUS_05538 [Lasallia pustulata]